MDLCRLRELESRVTRDRPWLGFSMLFAPTRRLLFGLLGRIAECRVQVLSLLRHNTDPHHIDGHAAILARADREDRIPAEDGAVTRAAVFALLLECCGAYRPVELDRGGHS
jgi:hypothetical protein